jgi:hypothetical protein
LQDLGRNVGFLAAGFIALLIAGFWFPYLAVIPHFEPDTTLAVHVHAAALFGWAALLLIQPLAIYGRAHRLHRTVGTLSLAVMALVVLSSIAMLHKEYQGRIEAGTSMSTALKGEYLSAAQLLLVMIAYAFSLVAARRRKIDVHWRLILIVVLLLLPAGLSRTLGYWFDVPQVTSQGVCIAINLTVLGALAIHDMHARTALAVYGYALAVYIPMVAGWVILGLPV